MKRLIYQVSVGKPSNLYKHCIQSVADYCKKYNIDHIVQTKPILRIKPDIFATNRHPRAYEQYGGYLPIFEKENAFASKYLNAYDQIAIVDADIYIRPSADNLFESMMSEVAFGSVIERTMPVSAVHRKGIIEYSRAQYGSLYPKLGFEDSPSGFEFSNMGMIVINTQKFKPFLNGQEPKEFLARNEFKRFIDGLGDWKWSTDQTLLNFFLRKYNVPQQALHWKWNGLYTVNTKIKECEFVHFFKRQSLPMGGENITELMKLI